MICISTVTINMYLNNREKLLFILSNWQILQWRHNGCDYVSNHQAHDCLLNRLFRRISKKTSKLRVTGLCDTKLHKDSHKAWDTPVENPGYECKPDTSKFHGNEFKMISDKIHFIQSWVQVQQITLARWAVTSWWRYQMEIFSALLALCAGNSPVTG